MAIITEKQHTLIIKLANERQVDGEALARLLEALHSLDTRRASETITWLLKQPRKDTGRTSTPVPEGMHQTGGMIFKVQRSPDTGNLYAKKLVLDEYTGTWRFEYARGMMTHLSADTLMTLEQAKQFGALYGTCCVCGRTLTNEESIDAGIGPICATKFGA